MILSSGFAEQEIVDRFEGAGLAGFLKKPVQLQDLLAKVAAVLEKVPV